MFKKKIEKGKEEKIGNKNILIAALLIHAAKIDENYTSVEKEIIKKALVLCVFVAPEAPKSLYL